MTIDQGLKKEIKELATILQAIRDIEFVKEKINSSEISLSLLNKLSQALVKMIINKSEKFN